MFNWLRRKTAPQLMRIEIVKRELYEITVEEWRADPGLVKAAGEALKLEVVRQMLATCRTNHLGKYVLDARAPNELKVALSERAAGYGIMLNTFESLGRPIEKQELPQATYAAENWEFPPSTEEQKQQRQE